MTHPPCCPPDKEKGQCKAIATAVTLLATEADSMRLALAFSRALQLHNPGNILFYGTLGAGKTTLIRHMATALPNGENAEIASPSFTVCNIYCTNPEIHHFDLYRLENGHMDEALEESFDTPRVLTLVEWAERLADKDMPPDGLLWRIFLKENNVREVRFEALGKAGSLCLQHVAGSYPIELTKSP